VIDAEGWFNTGDLARFDGKILSIVGRTKELIICSGFNVYPAEIEAVVNDHPAVVQSAVIGSINAPGSSRPQSTRIVHRKRRPTSKVDSIMALRARRGGTGSK